MPQYDCDEEVALDISFTHIRPTINHKSFHFNIASKAVIHLCHKMNCVGHFKIPEKTSKFHPISHHLQTFQF